MISGHDCLSGVKSGSKALEQEPWGSCFSPGCDSSLCLGFRYGQGLRAWGCTSMLVSLFCLVCIPSLFYFRGWVRPGCIGFTAASDVSLHPRASFLLPDVGRAMCPSEGYLWPSQRQGWDPSWLCSLSLTMVALTYWRAALHQDGLKEEPGMGWRMHQDDHGKSVRGLGSFLSAASMLWPGVSKSTCVLFKSCVWVSYRFFSNRLKG